MGKSKSNNNKNQKSNNHNIESDQQYDDPQAWGSSKRNYYQQNDQQYSSLSQQQQEAHKIYQKQHQLLNDPNYFINKKNQRQQLNLEQQSQSQDLHQKNTISKQYLISQIKWALQCQQIQSKLKSQIIPQNIITLFKKLIDVYLILAISLKEYKLSYIQHHPMVEQLSETKIHLLNVKKRVQTLQKNYKPQQVSQKYQQIKKKQLLQKLSTKNKSQKNKQTSTLNETSTNKTKEAFATINQNQARLANQMILKNKGLMKKRKKIEGNSRVKLRKKYQKAMSKQRALGHFIRENPGRAYQGQTNLKYGKIASRRFK